MTRVTLTNLRLIAYDFQEITDAGDGHSGPHLSLDGTRDLSLTAATVPEGSSATWSGVLCMEGALTGDGRLIEKNALRWENLPILLRYVETDESHGHAGAVVVGRITEIERLANGQIIGRGDFDLGSRQGREAARQVAEGLTTGVSVDLDDVDFEVRVAGEVYDEIMAVVEEEGAPAEEPEVERDDEGRVTVAKLNADDEVLVTTSARIRAATLVAIPAFAEARLAMDEGVELPPVDEADAAPLLAGGGPYAPPAAWFDDPKLSGPTPLTVTEEGRIYGHLAAWGTCHTAYSGQCVQPPTSETNYAYFRTGSVLTAEGREVSTGRITLDTLHASKGLSASRTLAHYEDTGTAVADVAVGEDDYGIWIAGATRPGLSEEKMRALRASPLSGDWRRVGTNLELVAALAVNVPGFPIPRPQGMVASGVVTSLVASGMLAPGKVLAPGQPGAFSTEELRYLKRLAAREAREQAAVDERAAQLARKVKAAELAARVRKSASLVAS